MVIPANVKSIGNGAFSGCSSLRSVVIEGECEIFPAAFTNCPALKKVTIAGVVHHLEPGPTPLMGRFTAQ